MAMDQWAVLSTDGRSLRYVASFADVDITLAGMTRVRSPWQFARDLLFAVADEARNFISPGYRIELVEHDDRHLVLKYGKRTIAADRRYETVRIGKNVAATFAAIKSIDIKLHRSRDSPDVWSVSLYLSWYSRVFIGKSTDSTEASIAAAHLSTITGKKVLSL